MNFNFPEPSSAETSQFIPEQLMKLANQQKNVKEIPLPTVDRVLEAIKHNKANEVTELEWIYCIHAKKKWDEENLNFRGETSQLIWRVAINNEWLRHKLLWHLALHYGGNQNELATSLAQTFNVLANSPTVNQLLLVKMMQAAVSNNSGLKLAEITCEQNLTRSELLNRIQNDLPTWIPQFSQFTECISPYFCNINSPYEQQVNWLLRCLDEMSSQKQVNAVNHLLINVSKEVASNHPHLVEWVRDNYRNGDKWNRLSKEAKEKLREWIGAVNYADFQHLVDLILPNLSDKDRPRQLKARQSFWANYSNSLQQLRILLTQNSLNLIEHQLRGDFDVLEYDGSDTTEVCIFDFGKCLIVEFFRGKGSETRFFPNNHRNQQVLFQKSGLSVKRIRALGGEAHDHVYLWQYYCRQWLGDKGICTNPATEAYNEPTSQQSQKRQNSLEQWNKTIERLEREARDYCE